MTAISGSAVTKSKVKEHWEREACGSRNSDSSDRRLFFAEIDRERYRQEPMLAEFAGFEHARGKRVLEVGLGTGSDFIRWVRGGAQAFGRDLTETSVRLVTERLALEGLRADVSTGDAERLEHFSDGFFDVYFSWGVLHHTPDTEKAIAEAHRVLRPGGCLKLMLYHFPSVGGFLVWSAHGPFRLNLIGPRECIATYAESPGTKCFTIREARRMIAKYFRTHPIKIRTYLGAGDLLEQKLSKRYPGKKWEIVQKLYPRWFVKHVLGDRFGTEMTIETTK